MHRRRPGKRSARTSTQVVPTSPALLDIAGLRARSVDEAKRSILNGIDLTIRAGEVHAVMGPNGSGKSTLVKVLVAHPAYEVTGGSVTFAGGSLLDLETHERALAGLFTAFQYPPMVSGVGNLEFLRAMYNAQRRHRGEREWDVIEFYGWVAQKLEGLKMTPEYLNCNVNEGRSGGERKRNEILQMEVLQPKLAILDEIDSGLDIDALEDVADAITKSKSMNPQRALLVVTHFERFLRYVDVDYVHVMHRGGIVRSGGKDLAHRLDQHGYGWVVDGL